MAELRRDPVTGRWIIVSSDSPLRSADLEAEERRPSGGSCPFCPGKEGMTPPEITARRAQQGPPNSSGWTMRVVPNKFPALKIEGNLNRVGVGIYDMMNGIGAHEVIIETPDHQKALPDFQVEEMFHLMELFKERSLDLRKDKRFRYLLIFKNYGESAGASLSHPHSQLIALPIVPKRVAEELKRSEAYFDQKERCIFCDLIHQELGDGERIVMESTHTVAVAPFASRFPFELWILPKTHQSDFAEAGPDLLRDVGELLRNVLGRMKRSLKDPSYNFLIHTSPLEAVQHPGYHWHLEIMPRLTRVAGFEWGSGFYINPTPPEVAAACLRGEQVKEQ
ncbi:MAG: galactose-1-phosphate uridylyltransferase [Candidatus Omnitrophica bacterium]|nr:galactose-1-phosphate uridylyltransferase [Candidatus Omnitrophota bacterium]